VRRAALISAAALAGTLALSGCRISVPTYPTPTTTPRPTTSAPAPTTSAEPTTTPPTSTAPTVTVVPDPTATPTTVPPTAEPTTKPPVTTTPPTDQDGTQAAVALGWGKPTGGDEFGGTALDTKRWGAYDGKGHNGQGRRSPSAITVADEHLTMTGDSAGTTGGMAYRDGQLHGRWETRMRAPAGDGEYHPVLLLWPDAEDWPRGGEVDYSETFSGDRQTANFFLHYSAANAQTSASRKVDVTQWHNWAVEWTGSCVTGYVDAQQWFQDCKADHIPPRAMHACIQLDWFPDGSRTQQSQMLVDWVRIYDL
jgi:hypothetical protein